MVAWWLLQSQARRCIISLHVEEGRCGMVCRLQKQQEHCRDDGLSLLSLLQIRQVEGPGESKKPSNRFGVFRLKPKILGSSQVQNPRAFLSFLCPPVLQVEIQNPPKLPTQGVDWVQKFALCRRAAQSLAAKKTILARARRSPDWWLSSRRISRSAGFVVQDLREFRPV